MPGFVRPNSQAARYTSNSTTLDQEPMALVTNSTRHYETRQEQRLSLPASNVNVWKRLAAYSLPPIAPEVVYVREWPKTMIRIPGGQV